MKKLMIAIMALMMTGVMFADNTARIQELTEEGTELINRKQKLSDTLQEIDIRLIQIQAILQELKNQDTTTSKGKKK